MKIRLNITPKLTLIFVLFAAMLLAVVSVLAYTSGNAALQAAATSELLSTAIEKQSALDAWVTETETHVTAISASPYIREQVADLLAANASGDEAEIQAAHDRLIAELQVWAGQGRDYLEWMVLDLDSGQVIAATAASEEGKFREDQIFFINGKSGPYLQNVYYSTTSQGMLLTVSAPIRSANGKLLAILAGNLDMGIMNNIITRRSGLRQSDDAYLVNTSELFATQPRFISDPAVLLRGVHTQAVERCLARNSGTVTAPDYRGVPALIVYRWLPERQLCLVVKIDQAEALAPALALRNNIFIISGLALLAAAALSFWLARTITRPVHQLAQAAREIGAGKLDTLIEVNTGDEISLLAGAFVQMTEDLKTTLVSRDDLLKEVAERKRAEAQIQLQSSALNSAANAILITDRAGNIQWINPAWAELTGYSLEEVAGQNPRLLKSGVQDEAFYKNLWDTILAGKVWHSELVNKRKDGSLYTEDETITPVRGESGEIAYFIAVKQDITKRKQADEELRWRNQYLAALQETTLELLAQLDLNVLLESIIKRAGALMGTTAGFLDLVDLATGQLKPQVGTGMLAESMQHPVQPGEGLAGTVWQTGKPLVIEDYDHWAGRVGDFHHSVLGSIIGVPLLSGGQVLGVFGLAYDFGAPKTFMPNAVEILTQFARLVTLAIENARLFSAAQQELADRRQAEEALRESEASLMQAQRIAQLGNWDWNIQTNELRWSDEIYRIFGLSPKEPGLTFERFLGFVHPEDRELVQEAISDALSERNPLNFDHRILCGGMVNIVHEQAEVAFDETGQPVRMIGTIQDVTERKQAEDIIQARLRLTEFAAYHSLDELLTKTLDEVCAITNSPIGFYHFVEPDQNTLSLQAWSTRTLQEYCKAEGKGLHYSVEDAGVWVEAIHQRKPVIHNDYASLPASRRKGLPEGHAALTRELIVPIFREEKIVAILGIGNRAQDYTEKDIDIVTYFADVAWETAERKQAEETLRESEKRFRSLFENMLNGFAYCKMIFDQEHPQDYIYLDVNHSFETLTGLKDVVGKKVSEVIPGIRESDPGLFEIYGRVALTGIPESFEMYVAALKMWFSVSVYSPQKEYFVAVFDVVTERKQAEQALKEYSNRLEADVTERTRELRAAQEQLVRQERLATLGQLAGSIGHELRNPLGVISNAIYFLKAAQPEASAQIKEYLTILENEARTSDKIVTDLLDFTRLKSVDREAVSVADLVQQTLERFPAPAAVAVTLDLPAGLPRVYVDPHHILQVLGNLTVNACQSLPASGGRMTISAVLQGDMVSIAVHDTGVGISPENMKKLFEPLFTTKTKGIGLGLAVSRKLVEANGGRIEVESEAGAGSTFTVWLPIHRPIEQSDHQAGAIQ